MSSTAFAETWLRNNGLFDADSDYGGALGQAVLDVWRFIAEQHHSGTSHARLFALLNAINGDYNNPQSPIWQAYWQSAEGSAIAAAFYGGTDKTTSAADETTGGAQ